MSIQGGRVSEKKKGVYTCHVIRVNHTTSLQVKPNLNFKKFALEEVKMRNSYIVIKEENARMRESKDAEKDSTHSLFHLIPFVHIYVNNRMNRTIAQIPFTEPVDIL